MHGLAVNLAVQSKLSYMNEDMLSYKIKSGWYLSFGTPTFLMYNDMKWKYSIELKHLTLHHLSLASQNYEMKYL